MDDASTPETDDAPANGDLGAAAQTVPSPPSAPVTEEPEARKSRVGLIVITAAIVIVALGLAIGIPTYRAAEKAKRERAVIAMADVAFDKAAKSIATAKKRLDGLDPVLTDPESRKPKLDEIRTLGTTAAEQLAAARSAMETLDGSSAGKTTYLEAVAAGEKAPGEIDAMAAALVKAMKLEDLNAQGAEAYDAGVDALDAGTKAAEAERYDVSRTNSKSAETLFAKARANYREAASLDPAHGFDLDAQASDLSLQAAKIAVAMAADGKAGRIDAYNAGVKKFNAINKKVNAITAPDRKSGWAESDSALASAKIGNIIKAVEELRAKARAAFAGK